MSDNKELEEEIRSLLNQREKADTEAERGSFLSGDGNQVRVGGDLVVDRSSTIIVNDARRPGERIDDDQQKQIREGPPPKNNIGCERRLRCPIRLATILLIVLAIPLLFSVVCTNSPPAMVSGLISAITADQAPDIQPADMLTAGPGPLTVVPYESVFECHAGCTLFHAPRLVAPAAAIPDQHI